VIEGAAVALEAGRDALDDLALRLRALAALREGPCTLEVARWTGHARAIAESVPPMIERAVALLDELLAVEDLALLMLAEVLDPPPAEVIAARSPWR
jgi:hypothetical protein